MNVFLAISLTKRSLTNDFWWLLIVPHCIVEFFYNVCRGRFLHVTWMLRHCQVRPPLPQRWLKFNKAKTWLPVILLKPLILFHFIFNVENAQVTEVVNWEKFTAASWGSHYTEQSNQEIRLFLMELVLSSGDCLMMLSITGNFFLLKFFLNENRPILWYTMQMFLFTFVCVCVCVCVCAPAAYTVTFNNKWRSNNANVIKEAVD